MTLAIEDDVATDLRLLRAYEPVVRYNQGELFFPTNVEGYLRECDLLVGSSERDREVIVPVGELTPERLATATARPGETLYLRLVQRPMAPLELARWRNRPDRQVFHAPGRLARVGLFARLVDAAFSASLLLRGTVPGGTAAAAQVKYARAREDDQRLVYYGRVVRSGGWIVLQYLYFYFMNDYRSTFHGANDHEADWEQVFVYLDDAPGGPRPVWIAAAAHDFVGDELRRRWDDPTLETVGDHPVVYAGAGSHASYFEQGEYVTEIPLPGMRGVRGLLEALRAFWRESLRQPDPGDLASALSRALSVPFVDYARGDGSSVGHGTDSSWAPVLIDDDTPWVDGYRGLFGLDTYDRVGGERAPAGPKYGRTGAVRMSWNDPLGFAGVDKVAPPSRQPDELRGRIRDREAKLSELYRASTSRPGASPPTGRWRHSTRHGQPSSRPTSRSWRGNAASGPVSPTRSSRFAGSWAGSRREISATHARICATRTARCPPPTSSTVGSSSSGPPSASDSCCWRSWRLCRSGLPRGGSRSDWRSPATRCSRLPSGDGSRC